MSPAVLAGLKSFAVAVGVYAISWAALHINSLGIPTNYLPLVSTILGIVTHWLPSPSTSLSASAQK